ncbi:kinesin-domain-containing protein [Dacryopinax primogenitus]|uniref:Kinesin-domain-containing protein n=1 Tax=Dacryopinax primogenitus (strain DJM 731) TaxID=1858805 RepID=M5FZV2_DACPD|nr:kinesin-domain-containing protein [Dacryopinax primogenitus]EJU03546.1 kinesin-domain-containing protein [Dacryopinax primogenitus]
MPTNENKPLGAGSRLPRPASSPDKPPPTLSTKRKADDDGQSNRVSKAPALGTSITNRPAGLRASRAERGFVPTSNAAAKKKPERGLTIPRAPALTKTSAEKLASQRQLSQTARTRPPSVEPRARQASGPGSATGGSKSSVLARAVASPPPDAMISNILEELKNEVRSNRVEMASFKAFKDQLTVEQLTTIRQAEADVGKQYQASTAELESLRSAHSRERQDWEIERMKLGRELREVREDLRVARDDLGRERETSSALKRAMAEQSNHHLTLETQVGGLRGQAMRLQEEIRGKEGRIGELEIMLEQARQVVLDREQELRDAEALRRKLHNTVMELKGNIRVFCRVRPILPHETENDEGMALISFPGKECREIVLSQSSETATGASREAVLPFSFDRVFQPQASQAQVFEEISQLAQSCTDGYNVCIFGYGQTSSGKTYTMEGGTAEEAQGMIPRAVRQIFEVTEELARRGWKYKMEGQFLEIYNETINDLLGVGELDKKHEIKHEKNGRTTVTDVVIVPLESPSQVRTLLARAQSRRTVHATLMNERSSRSHSVFTLRVSGTNPLTGEFCEGCLNLVDLAGSERLATSGAANDKDRLKETQAINKSLSALGDVIAALGEKGAAEKAHIPYRNSKLTYLLQNSLSGNSKTLMMLNLSPLAAHLNESLCSLRFATKVNNTQIGTARKQQARVSS